LIGEKGDKGLEEQLLPVGCRAPRRLTSGEITLNHTRSDRKPRTGHVYALWLQLEVGDSGPVTWNRDIPPLVDGIVWRVGMTRQKTSLTMGVTKVTVDFAYT
jgi:hypothetical protein